METIRETLRQERVLPEQDGLSTGIREAHSEIEFLRRRLNRLVKLQSLLKEKYHRRLSSLNAQLSDINIQLREVTNLAKQLRRNKESQATIKEQIMSLERRRRTLREVARQVQDIEDQVMLKLRQLKRNKKSFSGGFVTWRIC